MKMFNNKTKFSNFLTIFFYSLTRFLIWQLRPKGFSEIIYSYMPFAHLWASGVKPYLQQWYEYPPATIPLFYLPHLIDMATLHHWLHFDYMTSYRLILLGFDILTFSLVWKTHNKQKTQPLVKWLSLTYYCLATLFAHSFMYDTMDLVFAFAMTLGVVAPIIFPDKLKKIAAWIGYWLATCLKFVNAPLIVPYSLIQLKEAKSRKKIKLQKSVFSFIFPMAIACFLIWGLPVTVYRSSLQVSLVYHQIRGIQVDSSPALVIRTINLFTHSEQIVEIYKNYEMTGPITNQVKPISNLIFIGSILIFLVLSSKLIIQKKFSKKTANLLRISLTFGYIIIFLLFGKVLSRPFLIWQIPILSLLTFPTVKKQLSFFSASLLMLVTTLTKTPDLMIWFFPLPLLVGWLRFGCLSYLLFQWIAMITPNTKSKL